MAKQMLEAGFYLLVDNNKYVVSATFTEQQLIAGLGIVHNRLFEIDSPAVVQSSRSSFIEDDIDGDLFGVSVYGLTQIEASTLVSMLESTAYSAGMQPWE